MSCRYIFSFAPIWFRKIWVDSWNAQVSKKLKWWYREVISNCALRRMDCFDLFSSFFSRKIKRFMNYWRKNAAKQLNWAVTWYEMIGSANLSLKKEGHLIIWSSPISYLPSRIIAYYSTMHCIMYQNSYSCSDFMNRPEFYTFLLYYMSKKPTVLQILHNGPRFAITRRCTFSIFLHRVVKCVCTRKMMPFNFLRSILSFTFRPLDCRLFTEKKYHIYGILYCT